MRREYTHNRAINNLKIRPESDRDYEEIAKVNDLAFDRDNESKLIKSIRNSDRFIPELSLVAELDNKIVGHIMFSYIDLAYEQTVKVLALAPIAVLPKYQHQGIGSLLVKTGLEKAKRMQAPMVVVLGEPEFYHRFEFKPASKYSIDSPFDIPDEYFMVKFLTDEDRNYSGKIKYPAAFSEV